MDASSRASAAGAIVVVAIVLGLTLAFIFVPLMNFSRAMGDLREYRLWIAEWIGIDVVLTAFLCRKEIITLIRGPRRSLETPESPPGNQS